jgi:transcriptional regulator with XRE-family HTH domain
MTIGEKLTALRSRKGWTQPDFCKAFNKRYPELAIKRSRYSKWETDENSMEIEMLKAVVTFYQVTADEMIFDHKVPELLKRFSKRRFRIA